MNDEQLRKLERRYKTDDLNNSEILRLRTFYREIFGYCPSWFVIKKITDSLNGYVALRVSDHEQLHQTGLLQLRREDPDEKDLKYIQQYDQLHGPYGLTIKTVVEERDFINLPLIIIQTQISIDESNYWGWVAQIPYFENHFSHILEASFEQCGYDPCVSFDHSYDMPREVVLVTGIGYPVNSLMQSPITPLFQRQFFNQFNFNGVLNVKMATRLETVNIQGELDPEVDPWDGGVMVVPGSLRNWLLALNIQSSYLVLAEVSSRAFLLHSTERRLAQRALDEWGEYEGELPSPEMIYVLDIPNQELFVVPVKDKYNKTCDYLRLIAEK